jgi:subtilase family serine protease
LRQTSVSTSAAFASPGGKVPVDDTVDNPSIVTAPPSSTRFYLSLDLLKNAGDVLLTGKRPIPELSSGEVSSGPSTLTLPTGVSDGAYYVLGCADDLLKIKEASDNNNCAASPTTLLVGWADLITMAVGDPPATALRGGKFTVSDTARNQGTIPSAASYTRFYLSADDVKGIGDVLLTGTRAVASLAAEASSSGSRNVTVPSTTPLGVYRVLACADDTNKVSEQDNANCRASVGAVTIQ